MFDPYFASLIVCEKFCDSLPYYRQGQCIKRIFKYGVSRITLNVTAFSIASIAEIMTHRFAFTAGKTLYKFRKQTVEPVLGIVK